MSHLQYTVVVEESKNNIGEELEQNPTLLHHVQVLSESPKDKETLQFSFQYVEENGSELLKKKIQTL